MLESILRVSKRLLIIGLLHLPACAVHAEPVERFTTTYYDVTGHTAEEIRRDMDWQSPFRVFGKNYVAETHWRIDWQYSSREIKNACVIESVQVDMYITVTLPRLRNASEVAPVVLARWRQYTRAVREHEHGHTEIARHAARELEQTLLELPPQENCFALRGLARRAAERVIEKYAEIDKEYDRETAHGSKTGSVFP